MRKRWICLLLSMTVLVVMVCPAAAASHPFTDVPAGIWYEESVEYVYQHGLMSGTSAQQFSPDATMTRGMVVTVLYRLAGSPETEGEQTFVDVSADAYYYDAVVWALKQGITSGTSPNTFAPDHSVTREQLVTFLYRYAGTLDLPMSYRLSSLTGYEDTAVVSTYALVPFAWCVSNGIIAGTDATHLSPYAYANRAQCAAILARFDRLLHP